MTRDGNVVDQAEILGMVMMLMMVMVMIGVLRPLLCTSQHIPLVSFN
jgi:hypothetical protein